MIKEKTTSFDWLKFGPLWLSKRTRQIATTAGGLIVKESGFLLQMAGCSNTGSTTDYLLLDGRLTTAPAKMRLKLPNYFQVFNFAPPLYCPEGLAVYPATVNALVTFWYLPENNLPCRVD